MARMFWWFVFGMLHAWLIRYGDILVLYSVCRHDCLSRWNGCGARCPRGSGNSSCAHRAVTFPTYAGNRQAEFGNVDVKFRTRKTFVLAAGLLASLTSPIGTADPLHAFGNEGAWRHEYSGWQFARQVADFSRAMAPYTIDGNNDVGVRYQHASGLTAVVEVYLADSAATDAKLDGAKASAAQKAGESAHIRSERPFRLGRHKGVRGAKITYAADDATTYLYFFDAGRWTVKVLSSGSSDDAGKVMDAFVRALPWNTLGDSTALH